jgi:phosphonate transport system ATP-binding protein
MDILADLNRRDGITVLVSLHQVEYALRYCPRTIALNAGRSVYDGPSRSLTPDLLSSIYGAESDEVFALSQTPAFAERERVVAPIPLRQGRAEARRAQA